MGDVKRLTFFIIVFLDCLRCWNLAAEMRFVAPTSLAIFFVVPWFSVLTMKLEINLGVVTFDINLGSRYPFCFRFDFKTRDSSRSCCILYFSVAISDVVYLPCRHVAAVSRPNVHFVKKHSTVHAIYIYIYIYTEHPTFMRHV